MRWSAVCTNYANTSFTVAVSICVETGIMAILNRSHFYAAKCRFVYELTEGARRHT